MTAWPALGARMPVTEVAYPDAAALAAYLAASGDDNPLHSDPQAAQAAGFAAPLVPGMMILGQMAQALAAWSSCAMIHDLSARFVDPVTVGACLRIEGRVVALRDDGRAVVRLTAGASRRPAVLGEAVVTLRDTAAAAG